MELSTKHSSSAFLLTLARKLNFWVVLLLLLGSSWAASSSAHFSRYQPVFQQAAERYLPEFDWRWLAAQSWVESSWRWDAENPTSGAKGMMQFMDATWQDMQLKGFIGPVWNPNLNIKAGAYYMRYLTSQWAGRGRGMGLDALVLGQASFNCGLGCVLDAQRRANDARDFLDISPFLPSETRRYPHKVRTKFLEMTR